MLATEMVTLYHNDELILVHCIDLGYLLPTSKVRYPDTLLYVYFGWYVLKRFL